MTSAISNNPIVKQTQTREGRFVVASIDIFVPNLPDEFRDYRMVQLTDFHSGKLTKFSHIKRAFTIAASYQPDVVALTGDFVDLGNDFRHPPLSARLARSMVPMLHERRAVRASVRGLVPLFSLLTPRDGFLAVLGNHDYLEGAHTIMRNLSGNVVWLINDFISIKRGAHSLQIAGIDDMRYGKPNLAQAFGVSHTKTGTMADDASSDSGNISNNTAPNAFFRVLLSHSPDVTMMSLPEGLPEPSLVVCGHTHGGQIRFPFIGPLVTHTKQHEHVSGLSYWGKSAVYVSRGIGYGLIPLRLNCPPEITVFTLRKN